MTKKTEAFIGLDYDAGSIRGVRLTRLAPGGEPRFSLEAVHEIGGDFAKDDGLTAALAIMKEKLRIGPGDRVASCISGKQVYVAQMPFRKLKQEETRKALRLELRKTLPFDATTAAIEFQVLEAAAEKPDEQQLLVTAVASTIIAKHLEIMDKAGIKPAIVDTLPTCVANAAFDGSEESANETAARVVLHIGPSVCTLVICGGKTPFFHRNIYFAADELFGRNGGAPPPDQERRRRIDTLADEVMRSITYYQKNNGGGSIESLHLLGSNTDHQDLTQALADKTGLEVYLINLADRFIDQSEVNSTVFALALTLAMRTS